MPLGGWCLDRWRSSVLELSGRLSNLRGRAKLAAAAMMMMMMMVMVMMVIVMVMMMMVIVVRS
jgi:hypothetical protein